jgi:nucleoside-diphosphate-sugar epimerase
MGGDGTAIRAYTYVDDLVEGVTMLMQADPARHPELVEGPGGMLAIIGGDEYVTVDEVAALLADGDQGLRQGDWD